MSHHNEGEKKDKAARPGADKAVRRAQDEPSDGTEGQDVEGHNMFQTSDYYVQTRTGRQADAERDARQRSLVKEAKKNKPERR